MTGRTTGSWVIKTRIGWVSVREGSGIGYSQNAADALVFPTKTAAQRAIRGCIPRGERAEITRSWGHEESMRVREDWR